MRQIAATAQFRRDSRRVAKRGCDLIELREVARHVAAGGPLESRYRDHKLRGLYLGYRECHITVRGAGPDARGGSRRPGAFVCRALGWVLAAGLGALVLAHPALASRAEIHAVLVVLVGALWVVLLASARGRGECVPSVGLVAPVAGGRHTASRSQAKGDDGPEGAGVPSAISPWEVAKKVSLGGMCGRLIAAHRRAPGSW